MESNRLRLPAGLHRTSILHHQTHKFVWPSRAIFLDFCTAVFIFPCCSFSLKLSMYPNWLLAIYTNYWLRTKVLQVGLREDESLSIVASERYCWWKRREYLSMGGLSLVWGKDQKSCPLHSTAAGAGAGGEKPYLLNK